MGKRAKGGQFPGSFTPPMFLMPVAGAYHTRPLRAVPAFPLREEEGEAGGWVKIPPNFSFAG